MLGIQELAVVFVVALLVFGPKRLPELGKAFGEGLRDFRKALKGEDAELTKMKELIRPSPHSVAQNPAPASDTPDTKT